MGKSNLPLWNSSKLLLRRTLPNPLPPDTNFKTNRGKGRRYLKRKIWKHQDKCCFWCGENISVSLGTFDHLVPRSKGGSNSCINLIIACQRCNQERASKNARETIGWIKRKVKK